MQIRKITATKILHGARAYSHNASRRAHQLSVRKPAGMHGPVVPSNETLRGYFRAVARTGDTPCECGFIICAKRGPCAPVAAPIAVPTPSGGRFVVGQRVRYARHAGCGMYIHGSPAPIGSLATVRDGFSVSFDAQPESIQICTNWRAFEPLPSPVEIGEWVPPAPWSGPRTTLHSLRTFTMGEAMAWAIDDGRWAYLGRNGKTPAVPTLAQACAAALGIELHMPSSATDWPHAAVLPDRTRVRGRDIEEAARRGVERYCSQVKP